MYCINNLSTICNTEFNKETRIRTKYIFIYNIKKKLKLNKIKKRLKNWEETFKEKNIVDTVEDVDKLKNDFKKLVKDIIGQIKM